MDKFGYHVALLLFISFALVNGDEEFSNEWAAEISGGPDMANQVAVEHGFINHGLILEGEDYYRFSHPRITKRSLSQNSHHHNKLTSHSNVKWAEQQKIKRRSKRDFSDDEELQFNDAFYNRMWYLEHENNRPDMRVNEAWKLGYTGKNVAVTILDDGVERTHDDIKANFDYKASKDLNDHDDDPIPKYTPNNENKHGTRCAGEVAAVANNGVCSVGIAYNASIGGVRMLDGRVTDAVEAGAIGLYPQYIDIYSASWGPDDDGFTVDGPALLATKAFVKGVNQGRGGKGSIFVWASGNGGKYQDNCNCDGYTDSIYTLSISSCTQRGTRPWYSESCSSTLATTYSSGSSSKSDKQIVTTDLRNGCTQTHTGTSASAPLAAGICALALEANPQLTWRDMQHLVVETSKSRGLTSDDPHEWSRNGAGKNVSHAFGFGMMDARDMVVRAKDWKPVPPQRLCNITVIANTGSPRLFRASQPLTVPVDVQSCGGEGRLMERLEHVQAQLTLANNRRGELDITLVSPSGTRSHLLAPRRSDYSTKGFRMWKFMTTHNWGENPRGMWSLEVKEGGDSGNHGGRLSQFYLVLYGTYADEWHRDAANGISQQREKEVAQQREQGQEYGDASDGSVNAKEGRGISPTDASIKGRDYTISSGANSAAPAFDSCLFHSPLNGSCIVCSEGFVLDEETALCASDCQPGWYRAVEAITLRSRAPRAALPGEEVVERLVCRRCPPSCLKCVGGACVQCVMGAYMSDTRQSCTPLPQGGDLETIVRERTSGEERGSRFWSLSVGLSALGVAVFAVVFAVRHCHQRRGGTLAPSTTKYQYLAEDDRMFDDEEDVEEFKHPKLGGEHGSRAPLMLE